MTVVKSHGILDIRLFTDLSQLVSSTPTLWTGLFPTAGRLAIFFLLLRFIEIPVLNANSVDLDQTLFCSIWSRSALFAIYPFGGLQTKMG